MIIISQFKSINIIVSTINGACWNDQSTLTGSAFLRDT